MKPIQHHRALRMFPVVLLATLLSGCGLVNALNGGGTQASSSIIPLGKNSLGEDCRMKKLAALPNDTVTSAVEIYCGKWEQPGATIYQANGEAQALAKTGWWQTLLSQRMSCKPPKDGKILTENPAFLLECTLKAGGWPYLAFTSSVDGKAYLMDGISTALPTAETAIGVLSGKISVADAEKATGKSANMEEMASSLEGRNFGSGDMQTYFKLMELGQYYNSLKNSAEAEKSYRDALAVHEKTLGVDNPGRADPLMHLALEVSNQGRFGEAQKLFDGAAALMDSNNDETLLARFVSYQALHLANQNLYGKALERAQAATKLRKKILEAEGGGMSGDAAVLEGAGTTAAVDIVQSLVIEAAMERRLGRPAEAARRVAEAQKYLAAAPYKPDWWNAELLDLQSGIQGDSGQVADAESSVTAALAERVLLFNNSRPVALNHLDLARLQLQQGNRDAALQEYRTAFDVIVKIGDSLNYDQVAPFLQLAYERAEANPAEKQTLYGEMFQAGQLIRGGIAAKSIALTAARLASGDDKVGEVIRLLQEAQRKRDDLQDNYSAQAALAPDLRDEAKLERLRKQIDETETKIAEYGQQVQAAAPRYNQLVDAPVDAARVIGLVRSDEALIQVLTGNSGGFVFVIVDGQMIAYPLPLSAQQITKGVSRLRLAMNARADGNLRPFPVARGYEMYQALFGPVEKQIAGRKHLITIPSSALISLPFAVLPTANVKASGTDYSNVPWLIERSAISLTPSVRAFVDLRGVKTNSQATKSFIGFGDFKPLPASAQNSNEGCDEEKAMLAGMNALPETAGEIKQVAASFGNSATTILGNDFTRASVEKANLKDYRVLYFATHGLLPTNLKCSSQAALLTSPPQGQAKTADVLLTATDILGLSMDADTVVLSACNTGGGGEGGGEALSGLARSFFYAGARSLIVSHWSVPNAETVGLMTDMFASTAPAGGAYALQKAQIDLIKGAGQTPQSHPLYWGAFSLVGDGARGAGNAAKKPEKVATTEK